MLEGLGNPKYKDEYKHLVIVHGIGDQVPNATSLEFMNKFLRTLPVRKGYELNVNNLIESVDVTPANGQPPARFDPAFAVFTNGRRKTNYVIGFSEVYWQDITNKCLEGFKGAPPIPIFAWAHSINSRLEHKKKGKWGYFTARDAIRNLEKILDLLKKFAFLFKKEAQLDKVLHRFLGDVQMYTESSDLHGRINERFKEVLARVPATAKKLGFDKAEIYVVAHSEGTVISYSSLVEAAGSKRQTPWPPPWLPLVKGFVTLGSPLDKHYTIWKNRFKTKNDGVVVRGEKIPWFNYWDFSDPVGYGLKVLFKEEDSDAPKLFDVRHDSGFARYPIPGLAHNQYWSDRAIYKDIIYRVMELDTPKKLGSSKKDVTKGFPLWSLKAGDYAAYFIVRLICVGFLLFFLSRLLAPLKPLLETWPGWVSGALVKWTPIRLLAPFKPWLLAALKPMVDNWPSWVADVQANWLIWLVTPLVIGKLCWEVFARWSGFWSKACWWLRAVLSACLPAILWLVALRFAPSVRPEGPEAKDVIGYSMGLLTTILAWKLHSRVHRGLIQMWRYALGADTKYQSLKKRVARRPPLPPPPPPPPPPDKADAVSPN